MLMGLLYDHSILSKILGTTCGYLKLHRTLFSSTQWMSDPLLLHRCRMSPCLHPVSLVFCAWDGSQAWSSHVNGAFLWARSLACPSLGVSCPSAKVSISDQHGSTLLTMLLELVIHMPSSLPSTHRVNGCWGQWDQRSVPSWSICFAQQ